MASVIVFPSGPNWDAWDKHRGKAATVDADRLGTSYPADVWTTVDDLESWPGEGWTVVESDVPGFVGNMVAPYPFSEVRSKVGIGSVAAAIGAGTILGAVALVGLGWYLYRGSK